MPIANGTSAPAAIEGPTLAHTDPIMSWMLDMALWLSPRESSSFALDSPSSAFKRRPAAAATRL